MPTTPDFAGSAIQAQKVKAEIELLKANASLIRSKEGVIRPVSDLGKGLGAVTTPLADSFRQVVQSLPNTAKSVKRTLLEAQDVYEEYMYQKSHRGHPKKYNLPPVR